jgi:hypothetical protein
MDTALIGFLGVIVGALVSFLATLIASRRQNELALKNIKIEVIQKKISKLETALHQISTVKIDIGIGDVLPQQMIGGAMIAFSEKVGISQQCQHYLSQEITDSLNNLSTKVGEYFFKGKTGQELDVEEVKDTFSKIQEVDRDLRIEIQSKLKSLQVELDEILKA